MKKLKLIALIGILAVAVMLPDMALAVTTISITDTDGAAPTVNVSDLALTTAILASAPEYIRFTVTGFTLNSIPNFSTTNAKDNYQVKIVDPDGTKASDYLTMNVQHHGATGRNGSTPGYDQVTLTLLSDGFVSLASDLSIPSFATAYGSARVSAPVITEDGTGTMQLVLGLSTLQVKLQSPEHSHAPIPGSVLLLGSGLVGLVGLRRWKSLAYKG